MIPFRDALNISHWSKEHRRLTNDTIVPALLDPLAENSIKIEIACDLEPFIEFKRARPESRVMSAFIDACEPRSSRTDTRVMVASAAGRPIGIVAARNLWCERSLAEHFPSTAFPDEYWIVKTTTAYDIRCCHVAFRSGAEIDKDWQGRGLFKRMSRLFDLILLADFRWTWRVAIVRSHMTRSLGFGIYYYPVAACRLYRVVPGRALPDSEYDLLSCRRDQLLSALIRAETADLGMPIGYPSRGEIEAARATMEMPETAPDVDRDAVMGS